MGSQNPAYKKDVRTWQGRKIQVKIQVSLQPSRSTVPSWSYPPLVEERELWTESWCWSPCIHGGCHGVPRGRDPGAGRQCCHGQQEVQDHPQAPPVGYQE